MDSELKTQYAALPWRRNNGTLEFLLITTRSSKRWIIPKGWPIEGRTPPECAAQEAFEEAGLMGDVAARPVGAFRYSKVRKSGDTVPCVVHVFAMEIREQCDVWAEKDERELLWCSLEEAVARIGISSLCRVLVKFAKSQAARRAA